ncbi:hypothetical protein NTG1052_140031 [Candidatus Nitrotoga sp. 1052]|nr:hypothetical protein NTG1052_140031 [Candidatus Nitrotoga sp. 1052]
MQVAFSILAHVFRLLIGYYDTFGLADTYAIGTALFGIAGVGWVINANLICWAHFPSDSTTA